MSRRPCIAPSILASDFSRLAEELAAVAASGADWIHLDVMDGHFVPNLTFGPPVIASLRPHSALPFDVHLMIENPERWLRHYREAGADRLTIHLEACHHTQRYLTEIRSMGMAAGLSLNPQTPLCGLEYLLDACDHILIMTVNPGFGGQSLLEPTVGKIVELRRLIDAGGFSTLIEVDGGIDAGNAQRILAAGADVLVMGSAFFKERNRKALVREIKGLTPRGKQNARRPERVAGRPPIRGGAKPRSSG